MGHSSLTSRQVPTWTPQAPRAKAAASCRPEAMPPAAMTGRPVISHTWGTRAMVVSSPTWPPLSVPSAMKPSTPRGSRRRTRVVAGTTGKTLMPASFQAGTNWPGTPAPVVTTFTPSSMTTWAISAAAGFISMMFTPKGFSVRDLQVRMCSRSSSAVMPPAPMRPSAPALDTAAANSPVAMLAMPPWIMGNSVPRISFSFIVSLLYQRSSAPAQVRPPPKPTVSTRIPGRSLPDWTSSSRAMGMLAAEVLP